MPNMDSNQKIKETHSWDSIQLVTTDYVCICQVALTNVLENGKPHEKRIDEMGNLCFEVELVVDFEYKHLLVVDQ